MPTTTADKAFDIHPTSKPLSVPKLPVEEAKSAPKSTTKAAVVEPSESTSIPVTINQSKGLIAQEPKPEADEAPAEAAPPSESVVHHEKNIQPLEEQTKVAEPAAPETKTPEPTPEPEPATPTEVVEEPKGSPAYTRSEAASAPAIAAPVQKPIEPAQEPKVFDTTQYHLPIKTSKSHDSGKHMTGFVVVFILIIIIGAVIAIDAGWLDLGVELPFDFIQN